MIIDLHPNFIEKKGKKEFVVLPINEYIKIESVLEDFEDLIELRKAKKSELHMKGKSLSDIKKMLKIN